MTKKLLLQGIFGFLIGVVGIGSLLFLPAGTVSYWKGWLLLGVLFIPMLFVGIFLMIKNPELLGKRLQAKESQKTQKQVISWSALMFMSGFLAAGFEYRFGCRILPDSVSIGATAFFLFFYCLYFQVLRENPFSSRTVEIQEDQRVIDSGLYRIVRHPMYFSTVGLFFCIPLILGSVVSCFIFLWYPFLLVRRIKAEEILLQTHLAGYQDYQKKVKYRLIPFVW